MNRPAVPGDQPAWPVVGLASPPSASHVLRHLPPSPPGRRRCGRLAAPHRRARRWIEDGTQGSPRSRILKTERAGLSTGSFLGAMSRAPLPPAQLSRATHWHSPMQRAQAARATGGMLGRAWALVESFRAHTAQVSRQCSRNVTLGPVSDASAGLRHLHRAAKPAEWPALHVNVSGFGTAQRSSALVMMVAMQGNPHRNRVALRVRIEIGVHRPAADERHHAVRQHHMHLASRELALDHGVACRRESTGSPGRARPARQHDECRGERGDRQPFFHY